MHPLPKHGALPATHRVPDLLAPGLKLVFCGTALGRISAERQAYYANPGNFFWRSLYQVGLTPTPLAAADYPALLQHRIGLTDLAKQHFGNDAELPGNAFDIAALREKIMRYQPAILAFTSKAAAGAFLQCPTGTIPYGWQSKTVGKTRLYALPSPSGQARIYWDIAPWQQLADAAGALP